METSIKKILVPMDFTETSDNAMNTAIELAKPLKAELLLLHVVEDYAYQFSVIPEGQYVISPSVLELEENIKEKMDALEKDIRQKHGIAVHVVVTMGKIAQEITDLSQKNKVDLIVMGTHGVSGYTEVFLGSNAQRVVTTSEVPVLTIQSGAKFGFKKILIPIDDSLHSREKVNIAIELAQICNSEIHVLGLMNTNDKKEEDKFRIKLESVEKLLKAENIKYTSTSEHGENLSDVALTFAKKTGCDLIIINTGHESRTTGIFMGALAQQIVNHSKIPVMSVKPKKGNYIITTEAYGIS